MDGGARGRSAAFRDEHAFCVGPDVALARVSAIGDPALRTQGRSGAGLYEADRELSQANCWRDGKAPGWSEVRPECDTSPGGVTHRDQCRRRSRRPCGAIVDQAGWHLTPKLAIPDNITVLALPPRSPSGTEARAAGGEPGGGECLGSIHGSTTGCPKPDLQIRPKTAVARGCQAWNNLIDQPWTDGMSLGSRRKRLGAWVLINAVGIRRRFGSLQARRSCRPAADWRVRNIRGRRTSPCHGYVSRYLSRDCGKPPPSSCRALLRQNRDDLFGQNRDCLMSVSS